ncbi:MAG: hypothetical protein EP333_08930 [Bacteroidetes bacterium]|nr:MAG: hypothetical protein EP333_08930 [Bacteroidota bacterium]TNF00931.1 MAG: hypothetical protein EP322_00560 [Bacteroidota bacterium]
MRLPVIKHVVAFIEQNDEDYVNETIETLEHLIDAPGITDEELDAIGEILSNLSGALDVSREIKQGKPKREALNEFMQRVTGSIDK